MQRQLFLHHYFPALYFAVMVFCQVYDFTTQRSSFLRLRQSPMVGQAGVAALLTLTIIAFSLYAPLSYGNAWTQKACNRVKLIDTWDFDCNTFHTDVNTPFICASAANDAD